MKVLGKIINIKTNLFNENRNKTKKLKRFWLVCYILLVLLNGNLLESTFAITADFENFSEGFCASSFTDPVSGISFYDFLNPLGSACIEYVGTIADREVFSNTNYLTGSGYVIGDGGSTSYNFGFTAELGLAADFVHVNVLFSILDTTGTLTLNGYNNNNLVKTETIVLSGERGETTISIKVPSAEITHIELIPDGLFTGYDNLTAIPEPGTVLLVGLGGLALLRKRRV